MCDTFSRRMWRAIAFIESGAEHHRQLDAAFENGDGDAMCAAIYTVAARRPLLAHNLPQYVTPPDHFERAAALMGKTMREIRAAAALSRAESEARWEKWREESDARRAAESAATGQPQPIAPGA